MQSANLSPPRRQTSVVPVASRPRSRHPAHIIISTVQGSHRDLPRTRNSAAQPGRSQPRRREAFLRLARSQRITMLTQELLLWQSPRSVSASVVMVRRREEGAGLSSCSYLSQYDKTQRNDRRRRTQEDRSQAGRSRVLASNWLSSVSSAAARPTKGRIRCGSEWRGMDGMERPCDRASERWERIEEGDGRAAGGVRV
jgi:hypothetical protein